jgi:hypothetical protein
VKTHKDRKNSGEELQAKALEIIYIYYRECIEETSKEESLLDENADVFFNIFLRMGVAIVKKTQYLMKQDYDDLYDLPDKEEELEKLVLSFLYDEDKVKARDRLMKNLMSETRLDRFFEAEGLRIFEKTKKYLQQDAEVFKIINDTDCDHCPHYPDWTPIDEFPGEPPYHPHCRCLAEYEGEE